MVNKFSKICKDEELLENLKNLRLNLNEQRKIGKYCDWKLKTEDGGDFTVHKCVLETVCPFFETMLNSEFKDKDKDSFVFKRCSSSDVLEKLIEFMYTGQVKISSEIAKDTLDAALFLGLNTVVNTCTEILVEIVDCENCFELLAYSETYSSGEILAEKCVRIIEQYIEELKDASSFIELPGNLIKLIVSYDRYDCNEEQLFLAIVNWITSDIESREQYISSLMDLIKFDKMSYDFRTSNVLKDNPLLKNQSFQMKVVELLNKSWGDKFKKDEIKEDKSKLCNTILKNIYTFLGCEFRLFHNCNFLSHLPAFTIADNHANFAYTTFGRVNLMVSGGLISGNATNSCKYYSINKNCWNNSPAMNYGRYNHRMVELDGKLYVCGGNGGSNNIEVFSIGGAKWNYLSSFGCFTSPFGFCTLNGSIYALSKDNFQYYDPRSCSSYSLSPYGNLIYSAIGLNNCIYGFTERGIATYDTRNSSWMALKSYERGITKNGPQICVNNNKCYMISSFTNSASRIEYDLSVYDLPDFSFSCNYSLYKDSIFSGPTSTYGIFSLE